MEKYLILSNEFYSRKKLTQKEIEKNDFEQFDDTTIFKTNNKKEAEETIKQLTKFKYSTKNNYDCYHKNYTYKRFELIKIINNKDKTDYYDYESLGIYYPNYEEDEENE